MVRKIIVLFFLLLFFINCNNSNLIESKNYKDKYKRIEVLKKYFKLKSDILDTEFSIFDVNLNNRSIPGPTDRDYKIILKINRIDFDKWHEPNKVTSYLINFKWAYKLLENNGNFELTGINVQYSDGNNEMIIFKESGVILIRILQH